MKLNKGNYYSSEADKHYMSVSQLKSFMNCEARTVAELNGLIPKKSTKSFLEGHYLHAWAEGKLEEFMTENLEIYKYNNPSKGKMKAFEDIDKIIKYLNNDELIMNMIEGQKEVIMTANLFDVDWKFRMDIYNPKRNRIVDLKFIDDINKKFWDNGLKTYVNFVQYYQYTHQMVLYPLLEQIATGRENILEPFMVVVSKEVPPRKVVLNGFLDSMSSILEDVSLRLPRIIAVKNGEIEPHYCGECEYCRSIMKAKIINYKKLIVY